MKTVFVGLALSLALFSSHGAVAGEPAASAESILRDLGSRNAGYHDFGGVVEMVLRDGSGSEAKRRFTLKVLEHPTPQVGDQVLIVFESPADVKGTALLSHAKVGEDDEQWIYLPQTKRTKRIASSNRTGAFVGSEFTYEDLSGSEARKYNWRLTGTEPCGNLQCWKLEATPKDASSAYSKRVLTIDTTELRIFSTDFFDRGGAKVKTLTYDDYTKVGGKYWRAQRWTMHNHQTGKSTVLAFSKLAVATGVSASEFSAAKLGER